MNAPAVSHRPNWRNWRFWLRWEFVGLLVLALLPWVLGGLQLLGELIGGSGEGVLAWLPRLLANGDKLTNLFIFAILALGLNVVVGNAGLFHLGIGAFFGIGVYITGVLTVADSPFHCGFSEALVLATLGATLCGLVLGAPTLRLRGDYLALVTLGFGEVVNVSLKNLEHITHGMKTLSPIKQPAFPQWFAEICGASILRGDFCFYYLALAILAAVVVLLRNLECSRLGRAWVTLREDELAATCMGINAARVKLSAFALSAALAGLGGCLFATRLTSTADPDKYGFSLSITVLCCLILGGLGSIRGVLLGVLLLKGYELILVPQLDDWANELHSTWKFNDWRLLVFGLVLIIMVRFRPEGLLPSRRVKHELHPEQTQPNPKPPDTNPSTGPPASGTPGATA